MGNTSTANPKPRSASRRHPVPANPEFEIRNSESRIPRWVFLLLALLYFSAARIDTMDVDAAQYAEMSREMMSSPAPLHLYDRGGPYLDKPPMLFWTSAASMHLFGANNFGYKFPSVLAALLALYATYRLARRFYGEHTGRVAALVLGTAQGVFLMTNDVRTDTLLMGFVATALWAIAECAVQRRWYWVLLGTASIACGMMTKGPIALFVPLFAFGAHWTLRREWRRLASPWHLIDAAIIALFLVPMCIGLYTQFDQQPETVVNGARGVSGLRFFFWTQSFGRITGENSWANGAGPEFLASNMLWSFLPWMTLLVPAIVLSVVRLAGRRGRIGKEEEWISTGGFLLTYASLALSRYQLPHYIFVAFPLAAVAVAAFLREGWTGKYKRLFAVLRPVQVSIAALAWVGVLLILTLVFPPGWKGILLWALAAGAWIAVTLRTPRGTRFFWAGVAAMIGINLFLTHHFYPTLLQYQIGSVVGRHLHAAGINPARVVAYKVRDPLNALPFYAQGLVWQEDSVLTAAQTAPGCVILTEAEGLDTLRARRLVLDTLLARRRFKVSELTPTFLNQKTRTEVTVPYWLLRVR